ncbi:MAG: hypothetical protein ACREQ8_09380 [Woeseiaceae bacterium]
MKSPSLIAVTIVTLAMTSLAHADPPARSVEKIRKEYRGSEAPDYVMLAHEVRSIRSTAEWNRDIALWLVQKYMHIDSNEAAEAFLSRMVAAADELDSEYDKVWDTMVCGPEALRAKEGLYHRLDQVEDLWLVKSHNAYVKFMSELDESQRNAMTAWLEEDKEGFHFRIAEQKSSFESTGVDVVNHIDTVCAARGKPR